MKSFENFWRDFVWYFTNLCFEMESEVQTCEEKDNK